MQQQMAPLPTDITQVGDFTFVGIDYFDPFQVKQGRSTPKRWGCLFTRLITRAVHIEVAHSLSAKSFLLAFHGFMARRGKPAKVYSDNGTNFTAGEKELREEFASLNTKQVYDDMLLEAIDWKFIPAHTLGIWERLVRSIKNILNSLISGKLLTSKQLESYLCEVEKILNDRPLTKISEDPKDEEALTPSHILLMKRNTCQATSQCNNPVRKKMADHPRFGKPFL